MLTWVCVFKCDDNAHEGKEKKSEVVCTHRKENLYIYEHPICVCIRKREMFVCVFL